MCFFTDINKEVYLCAKSLGKKLLEELPPQLYNVNKLVYTWKKKFFLIVNVLNLLMALYM